MHERLAELVTSVAALVDSFEGAGIPYAFGGAIALSAWSDPRATTDIDMNVWVGLDRLDATFDVLESVGVVLDRETARNQADSTGVFYTRIGEYRLDMFVPSIPFYDEALARRRRVQLAGRDTWVLSAETLAVFKLLFFRPKDLVDVQRMMQIQSATFDAAFVRAALVDVVGDHDVRVLRWDAIVRVEAVPPTG